MTTAAYYSWHNDGRPVTPAQPIRDVVVRLKSAFPRAAHLFSWYADEAHYQADMPQDHTPFSATGWPLANPYPYVFATDAAHRPDLGVDGHTLFAHWIGEARAGRMPWLKYMIWQARIYDVRNGWREQSSSGHYGHIHLSARTDHRATTLGSWSLLPEGSDMNEPQAAQLKAVHDTVIYEIRNWTAADLQASGRIEAAVTALKSVVEALADIIRAGGGDVDSAAILTGVETRLEAMEARQLAAIRDTVADGFEGGAGAVRGGR